MNLNECGILNRVELTKDLAYLKPTLFDTIQHYFETKMKSLIILIALVHAGTHPRYLNNRLTLDMTPYSMRQVHCQARLPEQQAFVNVSIST